MSFAKAGPAIFSFRYSIEDAYATLAVPVCFGLLDEPDGADEVDELLQPAAASAMHIITSSAAVRAPWFFPGRETIVRR